MIHYLHDIRNKLTLISTHTYLLAKKYGEEDFRPIKNNVLRINELVNQAYEEFCTDNKSTNIIESSIEDFLKQVDQLVDSLKVMYPLEIKNEVLDFRPSKKFKLNHSLSDLSQILENAIGNSMDAGANTVFVRSLQVDQYFVIEIVDNGQLKKKIENKNADKKSLIPHGIGTQIIDKNMQEIKGKAEWIRRFDQQGMILRLYFPII